MRRERGHNERQRKPAGARISASNVADRRYVLKAQHSQKCLDIRDGSADDRAAVQQLTCNGTSAQSSTCATSTIPMFKSSTSEVARA
jgi:hypothetical protein